MKHIQFQTGLYGVLLLAIAASASAVIWSQVISTDTAFDQSVSTATVVIPETSEQDVVDDNVGAEATDVISESENSETTDPGANESSTDEVVHIDAKPDLTPVIKGSEEVVTVTPEPEVQDQVTIIINGNVTTEVPFTAGMTVHEAMKNADANGAFQYETSDHSSLGVFVESINGIGKDSGKNWILRVNGKLATVGASGYELQSSDHIAWTYEKNY